MAEDPGTGKFQPSERLQDLANKHGGMSPGMTSPDSTQAPLSAETGEPEDQTRGGAGDDTQGDASVGDRGRALTSPTRCGVPPRRT